MMFVGAHKDHGSPVRRDRVRHHELVEARLVTDTYYTEDGGSG